MIDLPVYPFHITFLILFAVMVIRYFMLAGLFYYSSNKSLRPLITPISSSEKRTSDDIKWSVISSSVFALSGAILINLWQSGKTLIYTDIGRYGFLYLIISLPLLMFVHDTYFYWTHRLLHSKVLFKRFHLAHHQSRIPTAWTSFAFHPGEAIIQAIILPLMLMIIPVHWMVLVAFLMIMTILGILNHLKLPDYNGVKDLFKTC